MFRFQQLGWILTLLTKKGIVIIYTVAKLSCWFYICIRLKKIIFWEIFSCWFVVLFLWIIKSQRKVFTNQLLTIAWNKYYKLFLKIFKSFKLFQISTTFKQYRAIKELKLVKVFLLCNFTIGKMNVLMLSETYYLHCILFITVKLPW